jgi:hypothetical protein
MHDDWTMYAILFAAGLFWWRLDRLGRQLEAVCANIKAELSPDPERGREILREWKEGRDEERKTLRHQLIFYGIIFAALITWHFIRQQ